MSKAIKIKIKTKTENRRWTLKRKKKRIFKCILMGCTLYIHMGIQLAMILQNNILKQVEIPTCVF